jgi:hypothetical protein
MAAETGEVLDGVERSADGKGGAIELEIVVMVAREGVSSGDPSHRGVWHVEEGAHGELVYDPLEPL